jgi:hypothetical protein
MSNIHLNTIFSNTPHLCSPLNAWGQVSHAYETRDKIIILCILIFTFLDGRREDKMSLIQEILHTNGAAIVHL